ncbi:MAG: anaerobic ribonucleoside-triphosphate reductase activating protein [Bacilli bacterium]|nr:anaerobic ribonucleoside-triphosphate reductase activating protein [Bacilli bacterium]MDD4607727.1 anaerobic ribonucleoside-triphosphate reductase activating protein [Bacilli bacterium]
MKIRLAGPLQSDSIVDGEGIRTVIWTQGCIHNCLGCHNPRTHSFTAGTLRDIEEVKEEIKKLSAQDGITLSGGDPMCQVEACLEIAKFCKSIDLNVWCYTGYTFEQLLEKSKTNPNVIELLKNIDVLVDGKFVLAEKSLNLKFKGSRNQRVLDVKKSLKYNRPYLIAKYKDEKVYVTTRERCEYIFV